MRSLVVPPALRAGARIAIVAPGSMVRRAAVRDGMRVLRAWGYDPVPGPNLFRRRGDLAGTDAERLGDLEWALFSPGFDAAWAARGGWGAARLLPALRGRRPEPRWLLGFSDLTAVQLWLFRQGIASWHAPLVEELDRGARFVVSDLRRALAEPLAARIFAPGRRHSLVPGRAAGRLAGGCLSVIAALAGTAWQPDLRDALLFLEDVAEPPYRIDRMLWQLRESGTTDGIAGLVFGQFTRCTPAKGRPSRPLSAILCEHARQLGVPAIAGVPAGHGPRVRALPLGYFARIDGNAGSLMIPSPSEVPVRRARRRS